MRVYPPELKAQVIAEWLAGTGLRTLAKRHQVPASTLQRWFAGFPRTATVADPDLLSAFANSVYSRAMEALDGLGAHLRAAARPELADASEGWTDRASALSRIVV